jgi:CheY-like chemotaxis protein
MDRPTRRKAFEPFFSTKRPRGRGLGLSSVYGIVRQSGGHLSIDSTVGVGTSLSIFLPSCVAPIRVEVPMSTLAPTARAETILVVEDEEVVRMLTAQVLRRAGFTVIEAENGRVARERARAWPGRIDLVLSDVVMPGETGPEVAAALLAERPGTRVLFMSGYTEDSEVLRGLREKRLELLRKPFAPEVLTNRVVTVLDEEPVTLVRLPEVEEDHETPPTKR